MLPASPLFLNDQVLASHFGHPAMNGALAALNSISDGILAVDASGLVVYINPAAEKMTGWRLQDAVGKPSSVVFRIVNSVTREEAWEPIRVVMQDAQPYTLLPHSLLIHKDGAETPVEDSVSPICDNNGKVSGAAVVFRDVGYSRLILLKALHRANHDSLTTLPNRALLTERLKSTLTIVENTSTEALLYIDVDRFKEINDTFGHKAGDFALQVVAKRISGCMRKSDMVCRFGGDEFVALVKNLDGPASIDRIVASLLACAAEPFVFEGKIIKTSISVGVALRAPGVGTDEAFLQRADLAMYAAKAAGGNGAKWFDLTMRSTGRGQTDFEAELQSAIDEERFNLCYQPQIDLETGQIVGAEALLRLSGVGEALLNPLSFIHIAERTGQIIAIGQMVLRSALKQQRSWRNSGFPIRVAVNVSPVELLHPEYLTTLDKILSEEDFQSGSLLLEFTETGSLHSHSYRELLAEIKNKGLDLAIDDFGTGHSNLDYLRRFPIDVIKIDREFLQNISVGHQDAHLLKAIIDMGRSLKRTMIAEGVETKEQLDFLKNSGCQQAQGFYFAPGITAGELFSQWGSRR